MARPISSIAKHPVTMNVPLDKHEILKKQAEAKGLSCASYCLMKLLETMDGEQKHAA